MNLVAVMTPVLLVIVLIAGCSSQVPAPSAIITQAPGPETTQPVETTVPETVIPVLVPVSPAVDVSINTTRNDIFFLEPLREYHVGDTITLNGTTILAAGDPLLVEVVSSSFGPTPKTSPQSFTGVSGIATVKEGQPGGPNSWSFSFPTDGFAVDTYIVTVSGITINIRDSTTFLLKPRN
jgi:hypothetical protein